MTEQRLNHIVDVNRTSIAFTRVFFPETYRRKLEATEGQGFIDAQQIILPGLPVFKSNLNELLARREQ